MNEEPSQNLQEEETITFKRSHFYSVLVVLAFAVGILVGYVTWGRNPSAAAPAVAQQPAQGQVVDAPVATPTPGYVRYKIPTDGFPSLGPANAPITIVEFSDYQCPFCYRFHEQTYQPLLDAYPGKIRFVYRNFPLTQIHQNAELAAEAALCAGDQNAYWQYHDKLFSENSSLNNQDGTVLDQTAYVQYATDLKLDATKFAQCLSDGKYKDFIQQDSAFANQLGINSTPTFFINGLAVIGAQPLEVFKQIIDKELAGEIPQN